MPYGIIETLNKIEFKKNFNKYSSLDPVRVRRLRIFGESGDLDIRQDHSVLYWRYVGRGDLSPQILEDNETEDFWVQKMNVNKKFFQEEKEAFLWGKYKEEKAGQSLWHENRVAKAKLAYPVDKKPQQVKICYKLLSENGQVAFIWLTGLKGG